ncbi:MAG: hypothetical protein ACTSU4_08415 [Promethearchaeota archaeon]
MIFFLIIGTIISWINMVLILRSMKVWAYLTIIFTTIMPCVGIGLKNRRWAYGYMAGFSLAGIPFMVFVDLFIGGYTSITTFFIFLIIWLIFWKIWRTGSIRTVG